MNTKNKIFISIKSGIIATAIMSLLIFLAPYIGFPRIPIWEIIAGILNMPIIFGWLIHFGVGIFFAYIYISFFKNWLPGNWVVKGMLFSLIPFLLAQTASLFGTGANGFMAIIGSLIGHLVYGAVLGIAAKNK